MYRFYMKKEQSWKLSFLTCLSLLVINQANAEYIVSVPLEQSKGGWLSEGTISFDDTPDTPTVPEIPPETPDEPTLPPEEVWTNTTPTYTAWVQNETLYGCNWTPSSNNKPAGYGYTIDQQSTTCKKDKSRMVQVREYNAALAQYRNVGSPYEELLPETVSSVASRTTAATGTLGSKVCRYLTPSSFYWSTDYVGGLYTEKYVWGGTEFNVSTNSNTATAHNVVGSWFYIKDISKQTTGNNTLYQVCRQVISNYEA